MVLPLKIEKTGTENHQKPSELRDPVSSSGSRKSQEAGLAEHGCQAHTFLFLNVFLFGQKFLGDLVGWELLKMDQHHAITISHPSSLPSEEMLLESVRKTGFRKFSRSCRYPFRPNHL